MEEQISEFEVSKLRIELIPRNQDSLINTLARRSPFYIDSEIFPCRIIYEEKELEGGFAIFDDGTLFYKKDGKYIKITNKIFKPMLGIYEPIPSYREEIEYKRLGWFSKKYKVNYRGLQLPEEYYTRFGENFYDPNGNLVDKNYYIKCLEKNLSTDDFKVVIRDSNGTLLSLLGIIRVSMGYQNYEWMEIGKILYKGTELPWRFEILPPNTIYIRDYKGSRYTEVTQDLLDELIKDYQG